GTCYVVDELEVKVDCPACAGGTTTCGPGSSTFLMSSLNARFSMGRTTSGKQVGDITLSGNDPSPLKGPPLDPVFAVSKPEVETILTADKKLRQVRAPETLADVVGIDQFKYELRFYNSSQVGAKNAQGLYQLTGLPSIKYVIENPDASTEEYNRLRITK